MLDFDGKDTITYGIGQPQDWRHFSRSILTDLRKGLVYVKGKKAKNKSKVNIAKVRNLLQSNFVLLCSFNLPKNISVLF